MTCHADLFKLVNAEDASSIPAMWSDFLSEAARHSGIADRQILGCNPLVTMVRCYWLFRRSYEVLLLYPMLLFVLAPLTNHLHTTNTNQSDSIRCHSTPDMDVKVKVIKAEKTPRWELVFELRGVTCPMGSHKCYLPLNTSEHAPP